MPLPLPGALLDSGSGLGQLSNPKITAAVIVPRSDGRNSFHNPGHSSSLSSRTGTDEGSGVEQNRGVRGHD